MDEEVSNIIDDFISLKLPKSQLYNYFLERYNINELINTIVAHFENMYIELAYRHIDSWNIPADIKQLIFDKMDTINIYNYNDFIRNEVFRGNTLPTFITNFISKEYVFSVSRQHEHDNIDINNAHDLKNLNSEINKKYTVKSNFYIDEGTRNYPWIWLDGTFISGENKDFHSKLYIEEILKRRNEKYTYNSTDAISAIHSPNDINIEITELEAKLPIAFGCVIGNICIIEATSNISTRQHNKLVRMLKQKFNKVYSYNHMSNYMNRLARIVK